jgi:alpha-ketoglutarate-dependent taurine dioxygenase
MFLRELQYDSDEKFGERLSDLLRTTKLVHIKGVPPNIDQERFYENISAKVGRFVDSDENAVSGEKTGRMWTDFQYDPGQERHFRYSNTAQPLHTDSAYDSYSVDVVFFFCVKQARQGGETLFLDSFDLIYHLSHDCPSLLDDLQQVPLVFKKGSGGKERPVITWDARGPVLTWNYYRTYAETESGKQIIERFRSFLEQEIVNEGRALPIKLMPGETVFFQDERLLHGRNAFTATHAGERLFWKGGLVYA